MMEELLKGEVVWKRKKLYTKSKILEYLEQYVWWDCLKV